jgi:hypothetical protein
MFLFPEKESQKQPQQQHNSNTNIVEYPVISLPSSVPTPKMIPPDTPNQYTTTNEFPEPPGTSLYQSSGYEVTQPLFHNSAIIIALLAVIVVLLTVILCTLYKRCLLDRYDTPHLIIFRRRKAKIFITTDSDAVNNDSDETCIATSLSGWSFSGFSDPKKGVANKAMRSGSTRSGSMTKIIASDRLRVPEDTHRVSFDIPRQVYESDLLERPAPMGGRRTSRVASLYSGESISARGSVCMLKCTENGGVADEDAVSVVSSAPSWSEYL